MYDITNEILEIFIKECSDLELSNFTIYDPIENMRIDSFIFIQILVSLEDKYNIEFSDSELMLDNFTTIEELAKTIKKHFEQ